MAAPVGQRRVLGDRQVATSGVAQRMDRDDAGAVDVARRAPGTATLGKERVNGCGASFSPIICSTRVAREHRAVVVNTAPRRPAAG
jgi:hypothetical protein